MIERIIEELVSIIVEQKKEIKELQDTLTRLEQYIDTYEKLIKGEK